MASKKESSSSKKGAGATVVLTSTSIAPVQKSMQIVENAKVVAENKQYLHKIETSLHVLVKTCVAKEKAGREFSEALKAYGHYLKETEATSILGKLLVQVANCQALVEESSSKFDIYLGEWSAQIKSHIKSDIEPALEAKKKYDSAISSFEQQTITLNEAKKKAKGPGVGKKFLDDWQMVKQNFEQTDLDTGNKLLDARAKNSFQMLEGLCSYVENYDEYLGTCQMAISKLDSQVREFQNTAGNLKADYNVTLAKRPKVDKQKMREQRQGVFGVTLADVFSRENAFHVGLPSFLKPIFSTIYHNSLQLEGIFRLSPNKEELKAFKVSIDQGNIPDFSSVDDPHVVSGLLGLWLREMPEPLCTFELYDKFMAQKNLNDAALATSVKGIVNQLPPSNKTVLMHLMHLLSNVALYSDVNKMTPNNLSIVFGPTILYGTTPDPMSFESVNKIVECMVSHFEDVFGELVSSNKYGTRPASTPAAPPSPFTRAPSQGPATSIYATVRDKSSPRGISPAPASSLSGDLSPEAANAMSGKARERPRVMSIFAAKLPPPPLPPGASSSPDVPTAMSEERLAALAVATGSSPPAAPAAEDSNASSSSPNPGSSRPVPSPTMKRPLPNPKTKAVAALAGSSGGGGGGGGGIEELGAKPIGVRRVQSLLINPALAEQLAAAFAKQTPPPGS